MEPTVDEHLKGHKFPFVSCELLCCDELSKMYDMFTSFEDPDKDKKKKEEKKDRYEDDDFVEVKEGDNDNKDDWFEDINKVEAGSPNKENKGEQNDAVEDTSTKRLDDDVEGKKDEVEVY